MPPITCESKGQFENILRENANKLIVVDFTASWCPPCQMIAPKFAELSDEYKDAIFLKVDVDKNRETAEKYGISAMPTFVFIKNGEKLDEFKGANIEKLKEKVRKLKD